MATWMYPVGQCPRSLIQNSSHWPVEVKPKSNLTPYTPVVGSFPHDQVTDELPTRPAETTSAHVAQLLGRPMTQWLIAGEPLEHTR